MSDRSNYNAGRYGSGMGADQRSSAYRQGVQDRQFAEEWERRAYSVNTQPNFSAPGSAPVAGGGMPSRGAGLGLRDLFGLAYGVFALGVSVIAALFAFERTGDNVIVLFISFFVSCTVMNRLYGIKLFRRAFNVCVALAASFYVYTHWGA